MSTEVTSDLVPVHGGLAEPVDRIVPLKARAAFLAEAKSLASIAVAAAEAAVALAIILDIYQQLNTISPDETRELRG